VALHLSALAPVLVACGHMSSASVGVEAGGESGADRSGNADASSDATIEGASDDASSDDADACDLPPAPPCSVVPDAAQYCGGSCSIWCSLFNGTPDQCGVGPDGSLSAEQCAQHCPDTDAAPTCSIVWNSGCSYGNISCGYGCAPGRRPAGLHPSRPRAGSATAALLAQMAYLEAASVDAFERLASELAAHGAPAALQRRAFRAARDERRHARVMSSLARRAGATVPVPRVAKVPRRSLEAIARENAVEGCVNETFSAALAAVQAECARDGQVRAAMRRIAADEARHAELAWSVATWVDTRLDAGARKRVTAARTKAARALIEAEAPDVPPNAAYALGLPTASHARRMAQELMRSLGV
jgi:rubrerythrin